MIESIGLVSPYPPSLSGIARFSGKLVNGLRRVSPETRVEVVRVLGCSRRGDEPSDAWMEIAPSSDIGARSAARLLNRMQVAVIQQMPGLGRSQRWVEDVVSRLRRPCLIVAHHMSPALIDLARRGTLVALTEGVRTSLIERMCIPGERIVVIPHGTTSVGDPPMPRPRTRLLTWGLLRPGKGIEHDRIRSQAIGRWRRDATDPGDVDVEVSEGKAFIKGTVSRNGDRKRLLELVEAVDGVDAVEDQLSLGCGRPALRRLR